MRPSCNMIIASGENRGNLDNFENREYLHIASYTRISIDPPCASDTRLFVEDTKLIKAEHFFQPAAHGNAGLSSPDDEDGVVGIAVRIMAVLLLDGPAIRRTLT